jgi:hypothetical protein
MKLIIALLLLAGCTKVAECDRAHYDDVKAMLTKTEEPKEIPDKPKFKDRVRITSVSGDDYFEFYSDVCGRSGIVVDYSTNPWGNSYLVKLDSPTKECPFKSRPFAYNEIELIVEKTKGK